MKMYLSLQFTVIFIGEFFFRVGSIQFELTFTCSGFFYENRKFIPKSAFIEIYEHS